MRDPHDVALAMLEYYDIGEILDIVGLGDADLIEFLILHGVIDPENSMFVFNEEEDYSHEEELNN